MREKEKDRERNRETGRQRDRERLTYISPLAELGPYPILLSFINTFISTHKSKISFVC
jgi:hypothetical protein